MSGGSYRLAMGDPNGICDCPDRDFQRQNRRKHWPCHPMKVFGMTFTKAYFDPNMRENSTSINRDTLSKLRGTTLRS